MPTAFAPFSQSRIAIPPATAARVGAWSRRIEAESAAAPSAGGIVVEAGAVEMPEGFSLIERADGLHLIRTRDGGDMGIMSTHGLAARHALALVRMGSA